jgi:hypothetical protein
VQVERLTTGRIPCDHIMLDEPPVANRSLLDQLRGMLVAIKKIPDLAMMVSP